MGLDALFHEVWSVNGSHQGFAEGDRQILPVALVWRGLAGRATARLGAMLARALREFEPDAILPEVEHVEASDEDNP